MSEPRHILFSNHDTKTYQYMGLRYNNDLITSQTAKMIEAGMPVLCQSIEKEPLKGEILLKSYLWDNKLYEQSIKEYERKTAKTMKRW